MNYCDCTTESTFTFVLNLHVSQPGHHQLFNYHPCSDITGRPAVFFWAEDDTDGHL